MAKKQLLGTAVLGFIVVDRTEDWEHPLSLVPMPGKPELGLLSWDGAVALFPSRKAAREAITRTGLYARAIGKPDMWPDPRFQRVLPVRAALQVAP